jgi:transposase
MQTATVQHCGTLREQPGLDTKKVNLLHDATSSHTACVTMQLLEWFQWDCLAYPPYSPDLVPSNLFRPLRMHFKGKHFKCVDEVKDDSFLSLISCFKHKFYKTA